MANLWLTYKLDWLLASTLLVLGAWFAHRSLRRHVDDHGLPRIVWLGAFFFVVASGGIAELAQVREIGQTCDLLEGLAPTYASETQRMGHASITPGNAETNPAYHEIIAAQKRWLRVNPTVADIYTIRREPDGAIRFIVDSETDYDHDGRYEGTRESRTPPGELFADADPSVLMAFNGQTVFDSEPYTDRWGTWVSVYTPLRDASGIVEAVLGVDYEASQLAARIAWYRLSGMAMVLLIAVVYLTAACFVINQRNTTRRQLQWALHDRLTGLPNRQLLLDRVEQALARLRRNPARQFAVLFIDFDRFKVINDSLGHECGDQLLVALSDRLRGAIRGGDCAAVVHAREESALAARLGGDEFVVLLEELSSPRDAAAAAERILELLSRPISLRGREVSIHASIGINLGDTKYENAGEVIRDADLAMYRAKAQGRAGYAIFDETMHAEAMARLTAELDLNNAVRRGEFRLVYQPIVELSSGRVLGCEALIRWKHPVAGEVPPARFIPLAEETGLIVEIGRWAIAEACRTAARWYRDLPHPVCVSVNLAQRQIATPGLVDDVRRILQETGLPPQLLKLEITESAMVRDAELAIPVMESLRAIGVDLLLDDFGTGFSSLSCLHSFPLRAIKLDRSFAQDADHKPVKQAIVEAVVTLARRMDLRVVAEGIETVEQRQLLRSLGCNFGQGYLFSRPLPADQFESFVTGVGERVEAARDAA